VNTAASIFHQKFGKHCTFITINIVLKTTLAQ